MFGWGWLAGWASQPPYINTIHMNQLAIFLSHINKSTTIQTNQPNRLPSSEISLCPFNQVITCGTERTPCAAAPAYHAGVANSGHRP